jgi:hypothetical protein
MTAGMVALTEVYFEADPFISRFRVKALTLKLHDYKCAIAEEYNLVTTRRISEDTTRFLKSPFLFTYKYSLVFLITGKGKLRPRTDHEGTKGM